MGKGRLSSEEIHSLLSERGSASPRNTVTTPVSVDAVVGRAADGNQLGAPQDALPSGEASSEDIVAGLPEVPENIARNLQTAFSETLRAAVNVLPVRAERALYRDFVSTCKWPTFFTTVGEEGGETRIAVDVSHSVLLAAINRMLGGSVQDDILPARPLTLIEKSLARRFVDLVGCQLRLVLGSENCTGWGVGPVVEHPHQYELLSATQPVTCAEFLVKMGSASGLLRFALPLSLLKQTMSRRSGPQTRKGETADPNNSVEVSAVFAKWRIPLHELRDLKVGDVIEMAADVGAAIEVELDGRTCFCASPGALRGNKAVKIEQVFEAT